MASEYLLKKAKEQTVEPERELTPEEKRKNWWDYHKWHVLIGLAAAVLVVYGIWDIFIDVPPEPDYQIAYVGEASLPDDTVSALESALAEKGRDLNEDGQIVVEIRQYTMSSQKENAEVMVADLVRLTGDVSACEFICFLMDDPASFQERYGMLAYPDGTVPEEGAEPSEALWYAWKDCPVLSEMDLGSVNFGGADQEIIVDNQKLLSEIYVGRGVFLEGWKSGNLDGYAAFWEAITEGAK